MKILIAGGGTAGHINPGIAIAKEIQKMNKGTDVMFVGTELGLESTIVPREGFKINFIRVSGFKRRLGIDTFRTIGLLFKGLADAKKIIKEFKPDIVIGTGGYVCGPVLFQASLMHIPTLIHESNAFPGLTNKLLSNFVDRICISFEESKKYFNNSKKIIYTGNPIRPELLSINQKVARQSLGLKTEDRLVVVMGGSGGAERINMTMVELIEKYYIPGSYRLIFSTGVARYENVMNCFTKPLPLGVEVVNFIFDAAKTYAASDVMVCRSGAITITELSVMGIPSILIPSPNVTANHQVFNAQVLEKHKAAFIILEKDLTAHVLFDKLNLLLGDKNQLLSMSKNAKNAIRADAANLIASEAMRLLR